MGAKSNSRRDRLFLSESDWDDIAFEYIGGSSLSALRTKYRRNHDTIRDFLVSRGIEIRTQAEATSLNMKQNRQGENHPYWKGGRVKDGKGYVRIYIGNNQYVPEHRSVMEEALGRTLEDHESVHHRNGIRDDNRLENLELWSTSQPYGQRSQDKLIWAWDMIQLYGQEFACHGEF